MRPFAFRCCSNSPAATGWGTARWGTWLPTTVSFCSASEGFFGGLIQELIQLKTSASAPSSSSQHRFLLSAGLGDFSSLVIKAHLKEFPPSSRASWFTVSLTWTPYMSCISRHYVMRFLWSIELSYWSSCWCSQQQRLHAQTFIEKFSIFYTRCSKTCHITHTHTPAQSILIFDGKPMLKWFGHNRSTFWCTQTVWTVLASFLTPPKPRLYSNNHETWQRSCGRSHWTPEGDRLPKGSCNHLRSQEARKKHFTASPLQQHSSYARQDHSFSVGSWGRAETHLLHF